MTILANGNVDEDKHGSSTEQQRLSAEFGMNDLKMKSIDAPGTAAEMAQTIYDQMLQSRPVV